MSHRKNNIERLSWNFLLKLLNPAWKSDPGILKS